MVGGHKARSTVVILAVFLATLGLLSQADAADCWAENHSYTTDCGEEDNINIQIFAPSITHYFVVATHPWYCPPFCDFPCLPDDCAPSAEKAPAANGDVCWEDFFDDHSYNAVGVCLMPAYWRAEEETGTMSVSVNGGASYDCHYLKIRRHIPGTDSWPEVLILYEDGNMRIKPHPPSGFSDTCFGSSVIIGPATLDMRPYADVESVQITTGPSSVQLDITFLGSETTHIVFTVDRTQATADVEVNGFPAHVAVFRSMWVQDGHADVDSVETAEGTLPVLPPWEGGLPGPAWFFYRQVESDHNQSAPDIRIVLDTASIFRVDRTGSVYSDGGLHAAAFQAGAADVAEWVDVVGSVVAGDLMELDPTNPTAYRLSRYACSSLVAGVVSTTPGVVLGGGGSEGEVLLALVGIVPVKVTDEGGPIRPGDLLVSSSTPGHAMRWAGGAEPCPCALVGKALEPMTDESGVILVLLTAH